MKIWIKSLIAAFLALVIGLLIPADGNSFPFFETVGKIVILIGRFLLFPMVFFGVTVRVLELNRQKVLGKTVGKSIVFNLVLSSIFTLVGILSITLLFLADERIPIRMSEKSVMDILTFPELVQSIFPANFNEIFMPNRGFLIPLFCFSLFFGWALSQDKVVSRPTADLFDSISKTLHSMNGLLVELYPLFQFFIIIYFVQLLKRTQQLDLFSNFLLLLVMVTGFAFVVVLPLFQYIVSGTKNPFKTYLAILSPALSAFFSGDTYFSSVQSYRHNEKNLGVNNKTSTVAGTFLMIFGRPGTALVTASAFILVVKSYNSLDLDLLKLGYIFLMSIVLSVFTGTLPVVGIYLSIGLLCQLYGQGIQEGYLILLPILPLLQSFSSLLDTVASSFMVYSVNSSIEEQKNIPISNFI